MILSMIRIKLIGVIKELMISVIQLCQCQLRAKNLISIGFGCSMMTKRELLTRFSFHSNSMWVAFQIPFPSSTLLVSISTCSKVMLIPQLLTRPRQLVRLLVFPLIVPCKPFNQKIQEEVFIKQMTLFRNIMLQDFNSHSQALGIVQLMVLIIVILEI